MMSVANTGSKLLTILKAISFFVLWLVLLQCSGVMQQLMPPAMRSCIYGILGSIIAFLLTWVYLQTEKKTFNDICLVLQLKTPLRFLLGVVTGAVIFVVMAGLLLLFGEMHLNYSGVPLSNILLIITTLFWLALMEEVAFRAYPLLKLKAKFGLLWAQLIMAAGFASYHFAIGWSLQTVLMGPFVWAWVYGLAAIQSRGIALSTGLHMAINIGQNLTGMSGTTAAVWKIDFNTATHPNTQLILIALHAVVFVIAVGMTYYINSTKPAVASGSVAISS